MSIKPKVVRGMRDYHAEQVYRREYIISTIKSIYMLSGFELLETPAVEDYTTLLGKYGEEGERLIFSLLNSGNFLSAVPASVQWDDYKELKPFISNKGLRYDLTVPLIRYIATHSQNILYPFKRYQIQPVWRADKPQKGRYREFLQCDADIVGSTSLLCEAELLKLVFDICTKLGIQNFCIKINHRDLLSAIAHVGPPDKQENKFFTIIDKTDKIGFNKVVNLLQEAGFSAQTLETLALCLQFKGNNHQLLNYLKSTINTEQACKATEELNQILTYAHDLGIPESACIIDPTLARGLAYYTGLVVEVTVPGMDIGSFGGGGRYDLVKLFNNPKLFGVGFSFGIDRIYDIMEMQNLFMPYPHATDVLVLNSAIQASDHTHLLNLLNHLRSHRFKAEIYLGNANFKKQLLYAHIKRIPFVIIRGETEQLAQKDTLKNMQTGIQNMYEWAPLLAILRHALK